MVNLVGTVYSYKVVSFQVLTMINSYYSPDTRIIIFFPLSLLVWWKKNNLKKKQVSKTHPKLKENLL